MIKTRRTSNIPFPSGTYYVGDLCYTLHRHDIGDNELWSKICELCFPLSGEHVSGDFSIGKMRYAMFGTMYGDGSYTDQNGLNYLVDSGSIGCVSMEHVDPNAPSIKGGQIIEFKQPFTVSEENGLITIGHIKINTEDEEEESCEDCGYESCRRNWDCIEYTEDEEEDFQQ